MTESSDSAAPGLPTLAYAILALLAREPLTGYEIGAQMRDPIGLLWQARHSQVYPTLARIETEGFASATASRGPGPRQKRRYAITPAGLAALRAWIGAPPGRRGRDELLLRVFASWVAPPEAILRVLRDAETQHHEQLDTYLERWARVRARGGPGAPGTADFADAATLRRGIGYERGRLAWVRWLIAQLEMAARSE